ncbi:MAG: hypothetical protein R6U89_10835 [Dehalococcoidia bacterium]
MRMIFDNNNKSFAIIVICGLFCLLSGLFAQSLIYSSTARAVQGLGISPPSINIQNALHNETYTRTINVLYNGTSQVTLDVTARGDISNWVSFYGPEDPSTSIESLTVTPGEWTYIEARFIIPDNAPVGQNTGVINFTANPPESQDEESQQGITLKVQQQAPVIIEVAGHAVLSGEFKGMSAIDTEIGQVLRIKYQFHNTGNVKATPEAAVDIIQDGVTVDSFSSTGQSVMPSITQSIGIEWPTDGRLPGDYSAHVKITLDGEELAENDVNFTLLPIGTLTRLGVLNDLVVENAQLEVGALARVLASFTNIGKLDTKARFLAEVRRDGELIDTIQSSEVLVPVAESAEIICYYKTDSPGKYKITGYVNYEGKQTDVREVTFEIIEAPAEQAVTEDIPAAPEVTKAGEVDIAEANQGEQSEEDSGGSSMWTMAVTLIIIGAAVSVGGGAYMFQKRSRFSNPGNNRDS